MNNVWNNNKRKHKPCHGVVIVPRGGVHDGCTSTPTDITMERFGELFQHIPRLRVIVCKQCATAIPPAQITTHLRVEHPSVPVAVRKQIVEFVNSLLSVAWKPEEVVVPKPAYELVDGLSTYENTFVCRCWYSCRTLYGIKQHCSKEHEWVNVQKRGGDARQKCKQPPNKMWTDNQCSQRLFKAAGWPAYFPVDVSVPKDNASAVFEVGTTELQHQRKKAKEAADEKTIGEGVRCLANAWIEFTGWPTHLLGFSMPKLLHLVRPANGEKEKEEEEAETDEDRGLGDACNAMRRVIQKAFQSSRPEIVGRSALEFINRRETGARTNEVPFYSTQKVRTVRKYSQKLVIVLRYLWRTYERTGIPPYKLTAKQNMLMWMLREATRSTEPDAEKIEDCCLRFWIALLDHSLPEDEYKNGLLSGIAVLGIKPEHHGGGWVPAHEYSQTLSALITTSRALVIYHAHRLRESALKREERTPTTFELIKDMTRRFMTLTEFDGEPSPMNRMLHMRTYAYARAKGRTTAGRVAWDRDRLLIDQQSFTLADLQSMAKGLCETVRLQLLRDVLLLDIDEKGDVRPGTTPLPDMTLDKLTDQPAEMANGWSFLKHPSNQLDRWHDWLFNRVLTETRLRERFVRGVDHTQQPPRIQWRDQAVAEYMKGVRRFKEDKFVLVHISGGAPARGSEITSIQCENGEDGIGYRGIFVHGGMISFSTAYHKGYSFRKRVNTIHRFVPKEVGEITVYYLGLGRPFVNDLQMLHNGVTRFTAFMWEPEPEEEWASKGESEGESTDREESGEEAGRGAKKKEAANPDGFWGTDRTRRVMREQTYKYLGASLSTSTWRHAYPAIHRELARDERVTETLDIVYYDRDPVRRNDARARQAGHSHDTEEMVYGRAMMESPFHTMAEREEFRRVSMDWHRVLGFTSAWDEGRVHPAVRKDMIIEQEKEELRRWAALTNVDIATHFKRLIGRPDAEFRGMQEAGLKAIMQRRLRVVVIMATGSGKSMLFMLPAAVSLNGGVTIVIVPLTALRADLKDRCDRLGIPCAEWDGRRPPYWASIVLVTPESAVTKAFGRFIDEKRMLRQLDRIVLDECHVLLESTARWRPQFLEMTEMTKKGTQVVYLTATLPPKLESAFFDIAGLDARDVVLYRDRTTRTNIKYQVQEYLRGTLDDAISRLVEVKKTEYQPAAQIIVYCRSIEETKRLGQLLRCTAYYKEVGTDDDKARILRRFLRKEETVITATNALGLGLDATGVRVVIHTYMCDLLRQYVQESGRAGRSGLKSEAILLRACWSKKGGGMGKETGRRLELPAREYLDSHRCRRISLDDDMDGRKDRQQCETGEEKCDFCEQYPRGLKRLAADDEYSEEETVQETVQGAKESIDEQMAVMAAEQRRIDIGVRRKTETMAYELERLQTFFDRWKEGCVICLAITGSSEDHVWEECPVVRPEEVECMRKEVHWLESIPFQAYSRCNFCWAPQAICYSWEEKMRTQGSFQLRNRGACQYVDVLKHAVAALLVFQKRACGSWLEGHWGETNMVHSNIKERLGIWFGQKVKLGQREVTRMCVFFYAWGAGQI